ncbi:DUF7344 domain-containing protein [Halorussus caseinilyticus]|uniref:DUF7344 domain-containing protein n=1 Tax=Halorussus caseinilyticus TaxID=3034025 RepID=A0ABD5WQ28_9EURY|nr:hypothetical protein [Halorussus sp. DT72]
MIGNRDDTRPPRASPESNETSITPQELWSVLSDSRRREVLRTLGPEVGRVALSDLAEQLAEETPAERVAIQLHHNHLPKLAEYGLVNYDHEQRVVEAGTTPDWVEPYEL